MLVRAKNHAREIAASLRARHIGFRAVEIEPLQDRAAVRDIIMLARALLHLGDRIAWMALLRAPWVGLHLADLLLIAHARGAGVGCDPRDRRDAAVSEDGRARCERLSETLDAAILRNDSSVARWIERTWLGLGGASCAARRRNSNSRARYSRVSRFSNSAACRTRRICRTALRIYSRITAARAAWKS